MHRKHYGSCRCGDLAQHSQSCIAWSRWDRCVFFARHPTFPFVLNELPERITGSGRAAWLAFKLRICITLAGIPYQPELRWLRASCFERAEWEKIQVQNVNLIYDCDSIGASMLTLTTHDPRLLQLACSTSRAVVCNIAWNDSQITDPVNSRLVIVIV